MARMRKSDIVELLVDEYGYDKKEVEEKKYDEIKEMMDELDEKSSEEKLRKKRKARRKQIFKIDPDEYIAVMNNTDGTLVHHSDRYGRWIFSKYGQVDEIPMAELTRLNNMNRRVLTLPYLIILDEEVVKQLRLDKEYENILMPEDVDNIFKLKVNELDEVMSNMTEGMKKTIASIAYKKWKSKDPKNRLTDIAKVDAIEKHCKVEIKEL
jgi:hypothetical protein